MGIKGWILAGFGVLSLFGIGLGLKNGMKRGEEAIQKAADYFDKELAVQQEKMAEELKQRKDLHDERRRKAEEYMKDFKYHHELVMKNLDKLNDPKISLDEKNKIWDEIVAHQRAAFEISHLTAELCKEDNAEDSK